MKKIKIETWGRVGMVMGLVMVGLGLPQQIIQIVQKKSTQGLNLGYVVLLFISFLAWLPYGYGKKDKNIFIPNVVGAVFAATILILFWIYK